jgi:hypothetical protein
VVAIKGVASEARFYGRLGERPSIDVDLVIAEPSRFGEAVSILQPGHPLETTCQRLVDRRVIHSLDLVVGDVPVDFHVDPLKIGVEWQGRNEWLTNTEIVDRPDGGVVRVFDRAATPVQMLVHVGRGGFRYLSTTIECRELMRGVDWDRVTALADAEGIRDHVLVAAAAIGRETRMVTPAVPTTWRAALWVRLWRHQTRLLGSAGEVRFLRRSQWLLPLTIRARFREALVSISRTVFPPRELAAFRHGDGPYLWRLVRGRVSVISSRRIRAITEGRRRS